MKFINIFIGCDDSNLKKETIIVDDFNEDTIKKIIEDKKDFYAIQLIENDKIDTYYNGIILSFDEVLDIVQDNPKYLGLEKEIKRHQNAIGPNGKSKIKGYGEYRDKICFMPNKNEFFFVYKKINIISDLIPDYIVDTSQLTKIKTSTKKYLPLYLNNTVLFKLFDDYVNIIRHISYISAITFNLKNYVLDQNVLQFFECYETFFYINDIEMYNEIKNSILKEYPMYNDIEKAEEQKFFNSIPVIEIDSIDNKNCYEVFRLDGRFTLNTLKKALAKKIKEIQMMYDGNDKEIKRQIDNILGKYKEMAEIKQQKDKRISELNNNSNKKTRKKVK